MAVVVKVSDGGTGGDQTLDTLTFGVDATLRRIVGVSIYLRTDNLQKGAHFLGFITNPGSTGESAV
jgi:hypothetical protein